MKIDIDRLRSALDAEHELLHVPDSEAVCHCFRFRDALLLYELIVDKTSGAITLAADPEMPIQACPVLEFSFRCVGIEIGENLYFEDAGDAVRFWEHRRNQEGWRLTLTPRSDGRWYIWANAWDKTLDECRGQ